MITGDVAKHTYIISIRNMWNTVTNSDMQGQSECCTAINRTIFFKTNGVGSCYCKAFC